MGVSAFQLLPPDHNIDDMDHRRFVKYLAPQPTDKHVSEVFVKQGAVQAKDGTLLYGIASIQLFYIEGNISFGVASINSIVASPIKTPPASPSSYFNFFDVLTV